MATVQAGIQYAERVLSGEIVAGELVRLACQRFLNDLEHGPERGIRHGDIGGYPVQYVERGSLQQDKSTLPNNAVQYRLTRDFIIYFSEV